jgi:hypothetical protein
MLVGVSGGTVYYKLNLPPWNGTLSDWSIFNSGGGISGDYLPLSGGTVTGATIFTNGVTANTISASTYLNLPIDVFVTGGTYDNATGTATFTNNTGGTFNVSGLLTGATDIFVTGGTYNDNTFTFTNNTGGTFDVSFNSVTGLTINGDLNVTGNTIADSITANTISATTYENLPIDIRVTGGTYSTGTTIFTNNTGGTFSVTGFSDGDISSYVTKNSLTGVTNWQSLTLFNGGASTVAIANNVIRVYPIILWEDITIDEIQIRITAGNGVGSLLIGIWKWENGLGTDLVYTSPVFNTNISGYQSFTSQNQFLPRGTYIIGYNTNLNGATIVSQSGFANIFGEQASGGGAFQLQVNHTYTGTLPTPFPTTAVANTFAPIRVQFKLI